MNGKLGQGWKRCRVPAATACFPSLQIECDLCQAQILVSTVRLHGPRGRSAPAKNPAKHFPTCIMQMKIKVALCQSSVRPEIHAAPYKEAVMLFLLNCTGPRCQVQGTWLKAGFSSRTASERNASEVFPHTLPSGRGRRGNGFHFGDCFFMTWQSYCCRWGQRRGTRGRWMLFWVFVSGCASMGPSMLCCVKSGGGFYRHLWLVSMFPCCLIQSFLIRPRNQTEGGGAGKRRLWLMLTS